MAGALRTAGLPVLAAALLGALQSLALVHTGAWWLALLSLAGLHGLVVGGRPGRAAWIAWAYGCAQVLATVWWLFISMHRYGGLPAPLAAGAVLLLCAALAVPLGAAMAWVASRGDDGPLTSAGRFAAAWLGWELARGRWFTGFPWGASGYGQIDGPLAVLAPWGGVYAMGAAAALSAGLVSAGLRSARGLGIRAVPAASRARAAALPLCAAALLLAAPPALLACWPALGSFTRATGELRVTLIQPNVAQDEKFATEHLADTLVWLGRALATADADLVLAPETAVPLLPGQLAEMDAAFWPALERHFARPEGPAALFGAPLGDEATGYTNSAIGLSSRPAYRYDKVHLVPFGEFIPTGFRWFTELMNIPLGDFARGTPAAPSFGVKGERVAPNICYEDLFGEELALRFADPARAPTVLANLSNIGWFGNTVAVPQHLAISRLRSLELQRPMLRATNTGATAVIDHEGRVVAALRPHTAGTLDARVQGREGVTPYAQWAARWGLWPLWACALLGLAWPARRRSVRRSRAAR